MGLICLGLGVVLRFCGERSRNLGRLRLLSRRVGLAPYSKEAEDSGLNYWLD